MCAARRAYLKHKTQLQYQLVYAGGETAGILLLEARGEIGDRS
jgi:hypothetical protein